MIPLNDVTFTIPVRIDTQERVRNLRTVLRYLCTNFDTNIMIAEESAESQVPGLLADLSLKYSYAHLKTDNPLMHRTKMLNILAKAAPTPIIVNYDTDVLLQPEQYVMAANLIRQNQFDMVYPYNGRFIDLVNPILDQIISTNSLQNVHESNGNLIHPQSLGGAIFWNKQKFIQGGMENEKCVSWGFEDNERLSRFTKLGYKIGRVDGCIFHMHHPASLNSANPDQPSYVNNQLEFQRVNSLGRDQLRHYVSTWPWAKV